jgi:RHS repeat-associated protein
MRILRILLMFAIASFAQSVFAGDLGEADLRTLGITDTGTLPPLKSNSVTWSWVHGPIRYDGSGNISSIGDQTFLYDTQNRLTRAEITRPDQPGSQVETYSYDAFGNMTTKTRNGNGVAIPTNGGTNRLNGPWVLYDDAGNLTRWQGDNAQVYLARYDALNRLQELKLDNTTNDARHVYLYTADGERIWSWNVYANVSEWNLRSPDNKVLRTFINAGSSWSLDRDYVYRDGQLLAAITPSQTLHFSLDHLGTPRVITDDSRIRVGFHHYFPFGEEWSINDGAQEGERKKFTGHERDTDIAGAATGLDYMHARYYRAGVGRFLSVDPKVDIQKAMQQPQTWNRYSYVENSPVTAIDPDGRETYRIRRIINGEKALHRVNPFSHSFIATTLGVIHTYSWGNTPDQNTMNSWNKDRREDLVATLDAINNNNAELIGDDSLDPYIKKAFDLLKADKRSNHRNCGVILNCKTEAAALIEKAEELKRQDEEAKRKQSQNPNPQQPKPPAPTGPNPKGAPCPGSPGCPGHP